jgi:hypothetical protein
MTELDELDLEQIAGGKHSPADLVRAAGLLASYTLR